MKQSLMEELISTVTTSSNIYSTNKNKTEKKFDKRLSLLQKEYDEDSNSFSDEYKYGDYQQWFLPHYSLTSRPIFIYLYDIGMFSFFDFGYQSNCTDEEYKNKTRKSFYQRLEIVKTDCNMLKYDRVLRFNQTPGSIWIMNHCPLCKLFKDQWVSNIIDDTINKQYSRCKPW